MRKTLNYFLKLYFTLLVSKFSTSHEVHHCNILIPRYLSREDLYYSGIQWGNRTDRLYPDSTDSETCVLYLKFKKEFVTNLLINSRYFTNPTFYLSHKTSDGNYENATAPAHPFLDSQQRSSCLCLVSREDRNLTSFTLQIAKRNNHYNVVSFSKEICTNTFATGLRFFLDPLCVTETTT